MTEVDYVANVQKRLGAKVIDAEFYCRICGDLLDSCLNHSECCALADATRGHYAVVRTVTDGMKIADLALSTEPRGLVDTQARPADIYSIAAVPGRSAALDVCVTSLPSKLPLLVWTQLTPPSKRNSTSTRASFLSSMRLVYLFDP